MAFHNSYRLPYRIKTLKVSGFLKETASRQDRSIPHLNNPATNLQVEELQQHVAA
jgi:hypothetical protein